MYSHTIGVDELLHESARRQMTEALVGLYRQSQQLGENGQAYVLYAPYPETAEIELGFLRSDDPGPVEAAMLFGVSVRKLTDDDVMLFFVQA